ncbi:hypothetical protein O181_068472 [Austropuccinia psidii MF-1]|uniref:Uncharacterized protein n=1 Tax=Austropuccinia psidii MF-1 TaxID=1389203 RepID=A0A9Q3EZD3_9BASI|nr:hypothetical protein [Austropuccinia psidii MF-1]
MGFKRQKQRQPNPPQQDSPIPSLLCEQTPRQPTPGPSGTQCELTLPPFVNSSQTNEPTIPCPSPSSKPHEDIRTCEPEPEVALTQSMVEPFTRPTPPHSVIIINNTPV